MVQWLPEYIKMEPQIVIIGDQVESITVIGNTQMINAFQLLYQNRQSVREYTN